MIIPSQHASRVARAAAGGGGGDVTPNAVNWANASGGQVTQTAMLQITGITSTITLRVVYTGTGSFRKYSVESTASFGTGTVIASNGTFTISNNQYLGFSMTATGIRAQTTNFTITNVSDADAVLDTFLITSDPNE
jgi:hypothetical protein